MPRHRVPTPLRWSDTDAFGHINNVQFLRLLEEARVAALGEELVSSSQSAGTALLVARQEIEYFAPLLFRIPPITIDLWVTRIGAADFEMAYEVLDEAAGTDGADVIHAKAETTLVVFDLATQKPRRITDPERVRLLDWADEPVRWRRRRDKTAAPR